MLTFIAPHRQYGLYVGEDCIASAETFQEVEAYWFWSIGTGNERCFFELLGCVAFIDRHSGNEIESYTL